MENNDLVIVAIDDNNDNLIVLKALIHDAFSGAAISTASDGKSGIDLVREKNPDVILLDIVMPEMDGFEVCRQLKNDPRLSYIPIVFLTALKDDKQSRIRALEAGGEAFISKPFEEAELVAQIRAMVKIKAANERQLREKEDLTFLVADRTARLEKELADRKKTGQELAEANRALEENKTALLNLLEDLNAEVLARKANELALEDSKAFLIDIVNTQPIGVYRVRVKADQPLVQDKKLTFTFDFLSERYCELIGFSQSELESNPALPVQRIHPDDLNSFIEENRKADLSMTRFVWEGRMIVNGQTLWVHYESLPRIAGNGDKLWTGVLIDITGQKLSQNMLIRVNQKLNILSELTRRDLDSRIFVLKSFLEMARKNAAGQEPVLEILQKIERVLHSITEISEISRDFQDMGAKSPEWQNVNMTLLFGLSHINIGKIRHSIETEPLEIFADPLLEKAFQGMFENSLVHGDHVSRIRVWYRKVSEGIIIIYEDNGTGIEQENKERVFLRGEGNRTSVRGLFFVREILDVTGITIRETGEPGKGTRFEITVPNGIWRIPVPGNVPQGSTKNPGDSRYQDPVSHSLPR